MAGSTELVLEFSAHTKGGLSLPSVMGKEKKLRRKPDRLPTAHVGSESDDSTSRQIRQHHLRLAADRLSASDTFQSELEAAYAHFALLRSQFNQQQQALRDKYIAEQQERVREFFKSSSHQHARLIKMIDAGLGHAHDLVTIRGALSTSEVDLLTQVIQANEASANARTAVLIGAMEDKVAAILRDWKTSHEFLVEDYNKVAKHMNSLRHRTAQLEEQVQQLRTDSTSKAGSLPQCERSRETHRSGIGQSRESSLESMRSCLRRDDVAGAVMHAQRVAECERGGPTSLGPAFFPPGHAMPFQPYTIVACDSSLQLPQYISSQQLAATNFADMHGFASSP